MSAVTVTDSDRDTDDSDNDREQEQVAMRRAAMAAAPEVAPTVLQGPAAAGQGGEEVALAAGRGGRESRRDPPPLVGSVRITPPRVRGRRRAGGGPAIPVVVLAPQEEGKEKWRTKGPPSWAEMVSREHSQPRLPCRPQGLHPSWPPSGGW